MIPDFLKQRYLRGKCLTFAIALKRELKLPIHVIIDTHDGKDHWIHAFVADLDSNKAYDIRGELNLDAVELSEGADVHGTLSMKQASIQDISWHMDAYPTETDIVEARQIIRQIFIPSIKSNSIKTNNKI